MIAAGVAGGQEGSDQPAEPPGSRRGQRHLAGQKFDVLVFVQGPDQIERSEPVQGGGGVEPALEIVPDVADRRIEPTPVAFAVNGGIGGVELVLVRLAHQVGAPEPAQTPDHIVGVFGVDRLMHHAGAEVPFRSQPGGQRDPAAAAPALVHLRQVQRDIVDIAGELLLIGDRADRGLTVEDRHVQHRRIVAVGPPRQGFRLGRRHLAIEAVKVRLARHRADDPADRAGAVQRALRPAQHLDPVDIEQFQVRIGGAVGDRNLVQIERHGRLGQAGEGAVRHAAQQDLVPPRPQVGDRHARRQGGHADHVGDAATLDLQPGDGGQGRGDLLGRLGAALHGDDDVAELGRRVFGEGFRGGAGPRARRRCGGAGGPHEDRPVCAHAGGAARSRQQTVERGRQRQGAAHGRRRPTTGAEVSAQRASGLQRERQQGLIGPLARHIQVEGLRGARLSLRRRLGRGEKQRQEDPGSRRSATRMPTRRHAPSGESRRSLGLP